MNTTLPGNHHSNSVGPILINCMDPSARDLMDRSEEMYKEATRKSGKRPGVLHYIMWLFEESGLVDDVREKALPAWKEHRKSMRNSLKEHPNDKFRRRILRPSIHSFSYWFFRWSGLVGPDGKVVS